jgi:ethanolamine utilization microcompartment shell protein EutS
MPDSTERLGELLVRMGALSQAQVSEILEYQKEHPEILFGQIAIRKGFITDGVLDRFLGAKT